MPVMLPLTRRHPKRHQPGGHGLSIDWSNPITESLVFYCPYGDGRFVDLVRGQMPSTNAPGDNRRATAFGSMLYTNDNTSNGLLYPMAEDLNTRGFTFSATVVLDAVSIRNFGHLMLMEDSGGTDITRISQNGTTAGSFRFHAGSAQVGTFSMPTGAPVHVVATIDEPSNDWAVYVDGAVVSSGNNAGVRPDLNRLWIGRNPTSGYTFSGAFGGVAVWNRALTAAEVSRLYQDRNMLLSPVRYFGMLTAGGGSDRNITGTLTAAAFAMSSAGTVLVSGTSAMQSAAATADGAAAVQVRATGALESGASTTSGAMTVLVAATGALTSAAASIASAATVLVSGTGDLVSGAASISGRNFVAATVQRVRGFLRNIGRMLN